MLCAPCKFIKQAEEFHLSHTVPSRQDGSTLHFLLSTMAIRESWAKKMAICFLLIILLAATASSFSLQAAKIGKRTNDFKTHLQRKIRFAQCKAAMMQCLTQGEYPQQDSVPQGGLPQQKSESQGGYPQIDGEEAGSSDYGQFH
ncbi:uncharacterized protein LOC116615588 [Nematostella vectensis]|uniref:uncharacterized protein LOC116615588 n=1 Tax=Nematostella vectensis TaxID=45351 RepID=UPI00138FD4FF|nr:uncharacterized protein LOC116615588 [Nematostella vectensis]